jgi:hypothetical protein
MGMVIRDPHYEWNTNSAFQGSNKAFYDEMGRNLAAAGVKWVRFEIFSEEFAPAEGSTDVRGKVNVEKYRYFIEQVAPRHKIKVLALLATPLVRQRPSDSSTFRFPDDVYGPGAYIDPKRIEDPLTINMGEPFGYVNPYMRIWLENAFEVAKAFPYNAEKGSGIAAFEVLNEENRYLGGGGRGLKPQSVAILLTKFYRAFKAGYPETTPTTSRQNTSIILGGLHPDRCDDCAVGGMNDRMYLDAIYKATVGYRNTNGKYPFDGIGYHPYAGEMRSGLLPEETAYEDLFRVVPRMDQMRNIMVQNGDTQNKFWVTEVGDRGAPITVDAAGDNERRQATFMRDIYRKLYLRREYIANVFWFKYEDFAVPSDATKTGTENWGVVRLQQRPTSQTCTQEIPVARQTCEYEQNGTVQRFKLSYTTYKDIAEKGFTFYTLYLPSIGQ